MTDQVRIIILHPIPTRSRSIVHVIYYQVDEYIIIIYYQLLSIPLFSNNLIYNFYISISLLTVDWRDGVTVFLAGNI